MYKLALIKLKIKNWLIKKLGGYTSTDVFWKIAENEKKWEDIILDKNRLKIYQSMVKAKRGLMKKLVKSIMVGRSLKVKKTMKGLSYLVEDKK